MRIFKHRGRSWLAATAVAASLGIAGQAPAQYAPYTAQPPAAAAHTQYGVAQPQYGASPAGQVGAPVQPQPQVNPYVVSQGGAAPAPQPQYAAQGAYAGYAAAQAAAVTPTPGYAPAPTYSSPDGAPRVAMVFQGGAQNPQPTLSEPIGATPPIETIVPGAAPNGVYVPQAMPESYPASGSGMGYAPGGGYESYPSGAAAGCNTCNTGGAYGACDTGNSYSTYTGMSGALGKHAGCGYWFGGVYGLLMEHDNACKYDLAFTGPDMPTESYPTFPPNVVLTSRAADVGYQGGVEFRLGRTFGCVSDPCSCTCGPRWGLEAAYWTLFEDDDYAQYVDQGTVSRLYTMMPMYGLQHNNGSGYFPVNWYWDHAPPSQATTDYEVRLARVRNSLEVHNLEINLLRLGACGGGLGAGSYSAACGPSACDTCDSGYGCSGDACATGACAPSGGSRYSCTGMFGFRWMQFNEDFMFGVDYDNITTGPPNDGYLDYWSQVENNLFGAQIGCNGTYRIGCKWGVHCNSLVGLYGNDVDVRQYFRSATNDVIITTTGEQFDAQANKTDVAMVGELRLGASYQCTCHCRLYGGWRVLGITGIALATEQMPYAVTSDSQISQYVCSNGSMILHGLQTGIEWNY